LQQWRERRESIAGAYSRGLNGLPLKVLDGAGGPAVHARHKFVLLAEDRDALRGHLQSAGVETRIHYPLPLNREPLFEAFGAADELPGADAFTARTLSLPIYPHLADGEVRHVIDSIRCFYGE
jgi:dTDP-3-amino-3,4,6-trideoxy-alpha-D-glucose transaminase